MAGTWREQLQECIDKINTQGRPLEHGSEIMIQVAKMSNADTNVFMNNLDKLNDLPFCGARAGTLKIGPPRCLSYQTHLRFVYLPQPPQDFASSKGLMRGVGREGKYPRVVFGIDFNELP